jgi:2'-5' RNA ligase
MAIQAFIDDEPAQQILARISRLPAIDGLKCDLKRGMFPHFTIGSWKVTSDEMEIATSQFAERIGDTPSVDVDVSLTEKAREDRLGYHLLPTCPDYLIGLHARMHDNLKWTFDPFRQIDLPGSWWPHLTLFSVPNTSGDQVRAVVDELSSITRVRVERLGLVSFSPVRTLAELRLTTDAHR